MILTGMLGAAVVQLILHAVDARIATNHWVRLISFAAMDALTLALLWTRYDGGIATILLVGIWGARGLCYPEAIHMLRYEPYDPWFPPSKD